MTCEPWCEPTDLCCDIEGFPPDVVDAAITAASQTLWALSGRRVTGRCTAAAVHCQKDLCLPTPCEGCGNEIRVGGLFGQDPEVVSVTYGGVVVPPTDYKLENGFWLIPSPGSTWATSHATLNGDTQLVITWLHGQPIPPLGKLAAADLACWFLERCQDACKTTGLNSVSFQGATAQMDADRSALGSSINAIPSVQAFMGTYNPTGQTAPSIVWSPDIDGLTELSS